MLSGKVVLIRQFTDSLIRAERGVWIGNLRLERRSNKIPTYSITILRDYRHALRAFATLLASGGGYRPLLQIFEICFDLICHLPAEVMRYVSAQKDQCPNTANKKAKYRGRVIAHSGIIP